MPNESMFGRLRKAIAAAVTVLRDGQGSSSIRSETPKTADSVYAAEDGIAVNSAINVLSATDDGLDPALIGIIAREFPDYRILIDIRNMYEITKQRIFAMHSDKERGNWHFSANECLMISAIRIGFPRLFNQIIRNDLRLGELISQCEDLSDEATVGSVGDGDDIQTSEQPIDDDYRHRVQRAYDEFNKAVPPFVRHCFTEDARYLSINYLLYMADWEGDLTAAGWVLMNSNRSSRLSGLLISDTDALGIVSSYAPREWARRLANNRTFMKYVLERLSQDVQSWGDANNVLNMPMRPWNPDTEQIIYRALRHSLRPSEAEVADITVYCEGNRYYHTLRSVYPQLAPGVQQQVLANVLSPICLVSASGVESVEQQQRHVASFIALANDLYKNEEATLDKTFSHNLTESDAGTCSNGMLYIGLCGETEFGDVQGYLDRERQLFAELADDGIRRYPHDAAILNDLGVLHRRMRRFADAERELREALALCPIARLGEQMTVRPVTRSNGTDSALRPGDGSDANSCIHVGPIAVAAYCNLGSMQAALSRFDEAQYNLTSALQIICYAQYPEDHAWWEDVSDKSLQREPATHYQTIIANESDAVRIVAAVLNNIGTLHIKTEEISKAEIELVGSIKMLNMDVDCTLSQFEDKGDKDKNGLEERYSTTEGELSTQLSNCRDPYLAMALNNLGNLHRRTSNQCKAQLEVDAAMRIYQRLAGLEPGTTIVETTPALDNTATAVVASADGRDDEYTISCADLVAMNSSYSPYIAMVANNCGNLKRRSKLDDEASLALHVALELYRRLSEQFSPINDHTMYLADTAMVLNNLGNLYGDNGEMLSEAERVLSEALAIRTRRMTPGTDDMPDIAMLHNNIGVNYGKMKAFTKARNHFEESRRIREELALSRGNLGSQIYQPRVADTENNLGNLYMQMKLVKDAQHEFSAALNEYKKLLVNKSQTGVYLPRKAMVLNNLGILYMIVRQRQQAQQCFAESLDDYETLLKSFSGKYEPRKAMVLNNLGNLYAMYRDDDEAIKRLKDSLGIYRNLDRSMYGANLAMTLNSLCVLYQRKWEHAVSMNGSVPDEVSKPLREYANEMADVCYERNETARAVPFRTLAQLLDDGSSDGMNGADSADSPA